MNYAVVALLAVLVLARVWWQVAGLSTYEVPTGSSSKEMAEFGREVV